MSVVPARASAASGAHTVPALIVCMGVSGCGKSTLGQALALRVGLPFLDADDLHSDEARARMARGTGLTEALRSTWLSRVRKAVSAHGRGCVLACSALRKRHRQRLRLRSHQVLFLHLDGPEHVIATRIATRRGHFAPASLLDSQLRILEAPVDEPDVARIDVSGSPTELLAEAERLIAQRLLR